MQKVQSHLTKKAFSSIEVLLAIALFSIVILSLAGGLAFTIQSNAETSLQTKAAYLAEEGIEAIRAIRNENYANLVNGNHGLSFGANIWQLSGVNDVTDGFTRQIQISNYDSTTKLVVSVVSWTSTLGVPKSISYSTYLSDWQYEVESGDPPDPPSYPAGNWSTITLPESINLAGNGNGSDAWYANNYLYYLRDSGTEFEIYNATDPLNLTSVGSTSSLQSTPWTFAKQGNYLYTVSRANNEEFAVVNVANPAAPTLVDTINLAGNSDGRGIHVEGNYAYVIQSGSSEDLAIIDISNPANVNVVGTENLTSGAEILKVGNYVYVATLSGSQELQVVDVSNPANPQGVASLNATGSGNCESIRKYATNKIVMGCDNGRIHFIDITNPLVPVQIHSYQASVDDINQIEVGNNNTYLWLLGDDNSQELIVLNITVDTAPVVLGTYGAHNSDLNGGYYDPITDTLYAASESDTEEIVVFKPISPP